MFPNAKEIPSPYYAKPVAVDQAQSLALHLYKDLPGRILRDISKEPYELVEVVRTSLEASYENWLQQGGCASREVHENPMTSAGDVYLDGGDNENSTMSPKATYLVGGDNNKTERKDSACSGSHNSETEHLSLDLNMTSDDREICQVPAPDSEPARSMPTMSSGGMIEFVLLQTEVYADWQSRRYQQMPVLKETGQIAKDLPLHSPAYPEIGDDQGLWYKFYLAVVMLKRKESIIGWKLVNEGCEMTRGVLEHPSRNFFTNLYNHFGSRKWDEFEGLRLHILRFLGKMATLILGTNHPLALVLRHLGVKGVLRDLSGPALRVILHIYEQALGRMHPDVIQTERSLCKAFRRQNEFERAKEGVNSMLRHSAQVYGSYDPQTRRCMRRLGHLYRYQEQYEDAEKMYDNVVRFAENGADKRDGLDDLALCTVHDLVSIAFQAKRFTTAEAWARLAMNAGLDSRNIAPENILVCVLDLHKCLMAQGRDAEATDLIEQYPLISNLPPRASCEEHALLSSISKDHFAWVLAESGHPYLLPDAY
jgi:tetratricopeptide (TPR) repeat protein